MGKGGPHRSGGLIQALDARSGDVAVTCGQVCAVTFLQWNSLSLVLSVQVWQWLLLINGVRMMA